MEDPGSAPDLVLCQPRGREWGKPQLVPKTQSPLGHTPWGEASREAEGLEPAPKKGKSPKTWTPWPRMGGTRKGAGGPGASQSWTAPPRGVRALGIALEEFLEESLWSWGVERGVGRSNPSGLPQRRWALRRPRGTSPGFSVYPGGLGFPATPEPQGAFPAGQEPRKAALSLKVKGVGGGAAEAGPGRAAAGAGSASGQSRAGGAERLQCPPRRGLVGSAAASVTGK